MPIYNEIKAELLTENYLKGNETTLKVQNGEASGKLRTGYLWSILGPPKKVLFHYAESRAGEVPKKLLDGFSGLYRSRMNYDAFHSSRRQLAMVPKAGEACS